MHLHECQHQRGVLLRDFLFFRHDGDAPVRYNSAARRELRGQQRPFQR